MNRLKEGIISFAIVFLGVSGIFLLAYFLANNFEPQPNYKELYEETQYNQTLQSAFNNGTIIMELSLGQRLSTCDQSVQIRYINQQTNQVELLNVVAVKCLNLNNEGG